MTMEKTRLLKDKAFKFRILLEHYGLKDDDAQRLLKWLTPLFEGIDDGSITPPRKYNHLMALGKEPELFSRNKELSHAEAEFISALEDW